MLRLFLFLCLLYLANSVDRLKFKTCSQSSFCKRQRAVTEPTGYEVIKDSIKFNDTALNAKIKNKDQTLRLTVAILKDSTARILIDEDEGALRPRYQPLDALKNPEPEQTKFKKTKEEAKATKILTEDGHRIVVNHSPFRVDVFSKDILVASINSQQLLKVEPYKKKVTLTDRENGYWEETFKDFKDSKPYGSSSVGVDIAFVGSRWVFGIPEHSESYALRDTVGFEPYRLYNLDVFEYEYHSPMALYGSIPYLVGTNSKRTTGMLWLNAAETWVDIQSTTADKTSLSKEVLDADTKPRDVHVVNTRFISETGLIDIFLTLGPAPHDSYRQLAHLLGTYPLPPYFSLGYHQSRWNYIDQKDVKQVHDNFEKHEIPLDVIWLDIDHTDKKAYFTWCKENFSDPLTMINDLTEKGRKLVTIVDPHVKKDSKYFLYKESKQKKLLVKAHDGTTFEGNCWPGDSVYIDFTNPKARGYWASRFAFDKYVNTTKDVHIWNDMNEPSVFNGPEGTMPKDAEHYNGLEHREVHNMYGFYQHEATYDGLIKRTNGEYRPFVLSRAFFAGSQRTAAVWTGDNKADWHHYRVSIPMLLSLSTAGIPHIGADVGGFMGDPDDQLLIRWYQAGAFQPFFRGHSHQNTKRREPWLFSQNVTDAIRKAIQWRYKIIPYLYTLFYEHSITGKPVMRSLWMEFRDDETSYDEDRQWMLGNALVVKPLQDPEAQVLSMYLPGTREIWYEWTTGRARPSPGAVQSDKTDIGLYQRGGTIVVARENVKLTAAANKEDPVVLYIASNRAGDHANGTLYIDDGETFKYRDENDYAYWGFHFKKKHDFLYTITNENLAKKGKFDSDIYIEKIYLRGTKFHPRTCHIFIDDFTPVPLDFEYDRETFQMIIDAPNAYITREFRIDIHI